MKTPRVIPALMLSAFLLPGIVGEAQPASVAGPFHQNIRSLGMGGVGVATGKGVEAMVHNPALLAYVPFDLAIPRIRLELSDDFFDIVRFAVDHQEEFAEIDQLDAERARQFLDEMAPFDDQWVNFFIAPAVGLSLQRVGLIGYSSTQAGIRLDKGIYTPRVYAEGVMDNVVSAGLSLPATPHLDVGASFKYIDRRESGLVKLNASALKDNGEVLQEVLDKISESRTGYGIDLGAMYKFSQTLRLGFVLQDALGRVGDDDLKLNAKAGVYWKFAKGVTLAGDIEDLLNRNSDSAFKKLHLGAELDVPVLKLRVGISQGYPSVGVGMHLLMIQFDYAYYGFETGVSPGDLPEWRHALQIGLGW